MPLSPPLLLSFRASTLAAQQLFVILVPGIFAACTPIQSEIAISPGEEFVLGGNQPGSYSVELSNSGTVAVRVSAEGGEPGDPKELATLDPGQELSHRFLDGEAAVLANLGASEASLAAKIYTARSLNMGYRKLDAGYEPKPLTAEEASEDLRILRRTIEEIHPGYGRFTDAGAMDKLFEGLEAASEDGSTDMDLYRDIARLLTEMRCDHTKAELPEAIQAYRQDSPSYLPFTFRLFGERMLVDRPGASGLARGDEIVQINGRPLSKIVRDIAPFVPVDGYTDATKRVEMEHSSEFLGDAVDHFWPFLYGWPEEWRIEARPAAKGKAIRVALEPVTYLEWLELAASGSERYVNFPDTVEFRMLDETTGYLSIGTFVNYRKPVVPSTVFDPLFDELAKAKAERLIVDLRDCGGGSDDVPAALMGYLSDTIVPTAKRSPWVRTFDVGDLRPYLSSWDDSIFQMPAALFRDLGNGFFELQQPLAQPRPAPQRSNRFLGDLTVLCSPANASGATTMIALLQEHYDARIVGEPTGGSAEGPTAGVMFFLKLPNSGIVVRVPAMRSWVNVSNPKPGFGVMPDVLIEPSLEDWLNERDVVLDAARRD